MPKQVHKYKEQRNNVLYQMFQILGINEHNNMFSLHKIDEDIEKQSHILNLENDIKKYFLCGEWTCFKRKSTCKRRWLSMIKYVVKDMGYQFNGMQLKSNSNGIKKYIDTMYSINVINKDL